jgi:hypothetical protein
VHVERCCAREAPGGLEPAVAWDVAQRLEHDLDAGLCVLDEVTENRNLIPNESRLAAANRAYYIMPKPKYAAGT